MRDIALAACQTLDPAEVERFAKLAASTDLDVRGENAMVYYALSRYVLLYAETQGKLSQLYADLRSTDRAKHAEVLARHLDEKAFRAWVKRLK